MVLNDDNGDSAARGEPAKDSSVVDHSPRHSATEAGFFSGTWADHAASGLEPRVVSPGTASRLHQDAFYAGARLLRLDKMGRGLFPQQLRTIDAVSSGRRFAAVLEPRQSSKTTTIEAWLLGLCMTLPGLQVAFSMGTTGKAARDHYLKRIVPPIEAQWPDPSDRPMHIRKAGGQERITFDNGSLFQVCATPSDYRGSSFDVIWFDESGELEGEAADEFLSAAKPSQDTRVGVVLPRPLLIYSGTAGDSRTKNSLHDALEKGRAGDPKWSIIEYSAGLDIVAEDMDTWADVEPLILASHPGVDTVTDLEMIQDNFNTMTRDRFAREYLGIFGDAGGNSGLINPAKWAEAEVNEEPELPAWFGIGVAVPNNQTSGSIVAAWRDSEGVACIKLLDHREGVNWVAREVIAASKVHKHLPIAYDDRGPMRVEMGTVRRDWPKARLAPLPARDVTSFGPLLVKEIHTGNLRHYGQGPLTASILAVRKRMIGVSGWAFGTPLGAAIDGAAAEAAGYALQVYDNTPERKPVEFTFV